MFYLRPYRFLYTVAITIVGVVVCGWWFVLFAALLTFELGTNKKEK